MFHDLRQRDKLIQSKADSFEVMLVKSRDRKILSLGTWAIQEKSGFRWQLKSAESHLSENGLNCCSNKCSLLLFGVRSRIQVLL